MFETEVLIAAARHGLAVREVPVRTSPRTAQRSRFRPLVDGVLIGAYLAEGGMGRWLVEGRAALAGVRARGVAEWWRHPRRRRATAAASGMALAPVLLGLAICQSLVGAVARRLGPRPAPDLVTPVVTRWFSQARFDPMGGLAAGPPIPPDARRAPAKPGRSSGPSGSAALASPPGAPS